MIWTSLTHFKRLVFMRHKWQKYASKKNWASLESQSKNQKMEPLGRFLKDIRTKEKSSGKVRDSISPPVNCRTPMNAYFRITQEALSPDLHCKLGTCPCTDCGLEVWYINNFNRLTQWRTYAARIRRTLENNVQILRNCFFLRSIEQRKKITVIWVFSYQNSFSGFLLSQLCVPLRLWSNFCI